MALLPVFPRRKGVSELYASVLMIGVTLSVGSAVTYSALGLFGLAASSASLGASMQQSSVGAQLGLVYAVVASSASCPIYQGNGEGTSLTVAVYNYGTVGFVPAEFMVNSTIYQGAYPAVPPGGLATYSINLAGCAHGSGLTLLAADSFGDEVQFGS